MTLDKSNTDKLAEFRADAQRLGIKVAPPSVNDSDVDFDVRYDASGAPTIVYALSAIKGVGDAQARRARRRARAERQFASLTDLARRDRSARASTRRRWNASPTPARSTVWSPSAPSPSPRSSRCSRSRIATPRSRRRARAALFGETDAAPLQGARAALDRGRQAAPRIRGGRLLPLRPSARGLRQRAEAHRRQALERIRRARCAAARRPASSPPACSIATSGAPRAARSSASSSSPTPAGQYEAIIFQEGLAQYPRPPGKRLGRAADPAGQCRGRGRARAHRPRRNR